MLSPYDGLSRGILNATKSAGIPNPVVTGQDAEKPSDKLILRRRAVLDDLQGHVASWRDTAATMVDDLLNGKTPETNDTTTYNNKVKVVPSYLHQSVVITKDNLQKEIVDSGYYTQAEIDKGE